MSIRSAICCAAVLVFTLPPVHAAASTPKRVAKPPTKALKKAIVETKAKATSRPAPRRSPPLRGPTETLTCRNGTEDRHARIGVVLVGGRAESFAYYSKWKPRTCSIYLQRNRDGYSRWTDQGSVTSVQLERGAFLIEHKPGEYRFVFRDIDRERYCGMDGTINGTLTIRKGSERCELTGIMEEGVALGQAYAHMEQSVQPAPPSATTSAAASGQPVARSRYAHPPLETVVIIGD
jgi:hypothetical protein